VDVFEEVRTLWSTEIARDFVARVKIRFWKMPEVLVRTRTTSEAGTYGRALISRHAVVINRIPGQDEHEVRDTCAHEVAHILTPAHHHDRVWRHVYRTLCEQAYGVKPEAENRFVGEAGRLMRELAAASGEAVGS